VGDSRPSSFSRALTLSAVAIGALLIATAGFRLTYNSSASLPLGVYRIHPLKRDPRRGDIVGVCLEGETARMALARGYVHPQGLEPLVYGTRCRAGVGIVGKPVAGVPGDTVDVSPNGVRVNGIMLERSRLPIRDRTGRSVPTAPMGRRVLRPGEYWLQSTYALNSFDSRIYGPVERGAILDLRVAVLVGRP
jgi:conjugative transfer signal peptidase TraF